MRSGRLSDIADVLKNLNWVQKQKTLSFREKKMYERARYLIVSEIAQVNGMAEHEVEAEVDKALTPLDGPSPRPVPRPLSRGHCRRDAPARAAAPV